MSDNRTSTISGVTITYPLQRVFAFTPYYAKIESSPSLAAGTAYTITFNGQSVKRYIDTNGSDIVPLSGIFQAFFSGVEFGSVGSFTDYKNEASKLMKLNQDVVVAVGGNNHTLTFDIIFGALQIGEREPSQIPLWMFKGLPLTITQNIGVNTLYGNQQVGAYGREVTLSGINQTGGIAEIKSSDGLTTFRTYNVKFVSCVPENSVFLRWVDIKGEYRYFLLNIAEDVNTSETGASYNNYPLTLNPNPTTLPTLVKNRVVEAERKAQNSIIAGVMSADNDITMHLESLNMSPLKWMYSKDGSTEIWTEVRVTPTTIRRKTREGNRQLDFEIVLPELYNQRL